MQTSVNGDPLTSVFHFWSSSFLHPAWVLYLDKEKWFLANSPHPLGTWFLRNSSTSVQLEWFFNPSRFSLLEFLNNKLIWFYDHFTTPCIQMWAIRSWSQRYSVTPLITSWLYRSFLSAQPFLQEFDSVSQWVLTRNVGSFITGRRVVQPHTSSVLYCSSFQTLDCLTGTSLRKNLPRSDIYAST